MLRLINRLSVGRFMYLFLFLAVFLIISTSVENENNAFVNLFLLTLFLSCIYIVSHSKLLILINVILLITTYSTKAFVVFHSENYYQVVEYLVASGFFFFNSVAILYQVLKMKVISLDKIYAALCVYLLLGIGWGFVYSAVGVYDTNAFHFVYTEQNFGEILYPYLVYFSFVTQTTLGYGDIIPISLFAKSLSIMEAIMGQLYLVVMIARLIGIYIAQTHQRE